MLASVKRPEKYLGVALNNINIKIIHPTRHSPDSPLEKTILQFISTNKF